jgi:hypothetical protein
VGSEVTDDFAEHSTFGAAEPFTVAGSQASSARDRCAGHSTDAQPEPAQCSAEARPQSLAQEAAEALAAFGVASEAQGGPRTRSSTATGASSGLSTSLVEVRGSDKGEATHGHDG